MSKHRTNYTKYNKPVEEDVSVDAEIEDFNNISEETDITVEEVEEESEIKTAIVNIPEGTKLNVRSDKSFDFEPITQISDLQEVQILDQNDPEWCKICTASGIEGYIQKKYVTFKIN